MSLLLSGQGEKASPLLRTARKYCTHVSYALTLAGFLWLLALPLQTLSRRTYFSENAMMPGQVELSFGSENHIEAMNSMNEAEQLGGEQRGRAVMAAFEGLGLDSEMQRFKHNGVSGINVHGVVRAPRGDGVEALVVAAAWEAGNRTNADAVRLLAGLAQHAIEQVNWAKDVVFLVTDSGEGGIEAWLRAYHGEGGAMYVRSGLIQAALALELPPMNACGGLALHFEGRGGQLPNLDLLNIVQHVARIERTPARLHGLPDAPRRASRYAHYLQSARLLLRQVRAQAVGSAVGVHAPFLRYGIDALTLVGMERVGARGGGNIVSVGRTIEASLRSLNNLLERFHQSFFFYLLPANGLFISIGNYVPAAVLFAAALLVHAMNLWWLQGPEESRSESPQDRIPRINAYHAFLRKSLPTSVGLIVRVHALAAALLALPMLVPQITMTDSTATAYLFTMSLASISLVLHLSDELRSHACLADWRQLKALVCVYVACVVACLSVMNFSLAIAMFVVIGLPLLFTRLSASPTRVHRACTMLMLLAFSPLSVLSVSRYFLASGAVDQMSSPFRIFLSDFNQFGSPVYALICLVYWPINLLCMVITLMP
ncbi:Glycosyl phosphatidyl inositol protein transamidase complex subunit [Kickxella alabastrina]|uniref:Glycosyl phosphatidyl inositol protein transamidase complex subunit n=1 Tax=Kickxella alabastrina TaxID=61397 RepID=A0ACC1IHP9_9FUNG|nr:Glycosyl phosphatidyl inositol protein transamidase complex subunit [Kickxella alabastrina]